MNQQPRIKSAMVKLTNAYKAYLKANYDYNALLNAVRPSENVATFTWSHKLKKRKNPGRRNK